MSANRSLIVPVALALCLWSPLLLAACAAPVVEPLVSDCPSTIAVLAESGAQLPAPRQAAPLEAAASSHQLPVEIWSVRDTTELRDVLYGWSSRAGWSLVWDSEYSYQMQANATFKGDFVSAVKQLFAALGQVNPPLYPQIYQGNRVLVVKAQPNR